MGINKGIIQENLPGSWLQKLLKVKGEPMFNSNKTKMSPLVKNMVKANGGQNMDKPSFGTTFSQGERGKSAVFYYGKNSPDMTVETNK